MAHIIEFTVEGLAGRKEVYSQKLNRDINVFFGLNGSGKTSLLKILHSAMEGNALLLRNVPFKMAQVKIYSVDFKDVFTRTLRKSTLDKISSNPFAYNIQGNIVKYLGTSHENAWETTPQKPDKTSGWVHSYLPTTRLWASPEFRRSGGYGETETISTEERLDLYFEQALEVLWTSYVGEVLNKVRKAQEEGLASILKEILSSDRHALTEQILDSETAYNRVKAFLARQGPSGILGPLDKFEKRYSKDVLLKNVVSHINEVELSIEGAMAPRNRVQKLIRKMFSGDKKVLFTDKSIDVVTEDNSKISLASLSAGEKHVLRILIEVLNAEVNSLLIDEPEISMHIDWQRELIPAMQSVNSLAQLILATHSPEVMAPIEDSKIFRL